MANDNSKDVANSLSGYSNTINKGTNAILDSANQINKWYAEQLDKIAKVDNVDSRIETNVDNTIPEDIEDTKEKISKLETKVDNYTEIQTNKKNNNIIQNTNRIKTQKEEESIEEIIENETVELNSKKNSKIPKRISTAIKGVKVINNTTNKFVKTGKTLNTSINEGGLKSFENSSSKIMTKPARSITKKAYSKATNKIKKSTKQLVKSNGKKVIKKATRVIEKTAKIVSKLIVETINIIMSIFPTLAPIIIIVIIIAILGSFLNINTMEEADNIDFNEVIKYIVEIDDPNLQAIYNEYLKNIGKPYLLDHSNLKYDECMDYYDCSSFVIHSLAHTGIKEIPDTTASGLYTDYCEPVEVNDRKAGDLIFLKDTYDTGTPGGISHVGIYMGTLTINEETAEWIIDTGGNPEGVKISKYNNGWWNGSNFYAFGRLK